VVQSPLQALRELNFSTSQKSSGQSRTINCQWRIQDFLKGGADLNSRGATNYKARRNIDEIVARGASENFFLPQSIWFPGEYEIKHYTCFNFFLAHDKLSQDLLVTM
jgi:hypothetical protein